MSKIKATSPLYRDNMQKRLRDILQEKNRESILKDTPSFPLALNVEMPEGHSSKNGHLSFSLRNFSCRGMEKFEMITPTDAFKDGHLHLVFSFNQLNIKGQYTIDSKYAPEIDLDTAGTTLELNANGYTVAAAGADPGTGAFSDDQKNAMLDQARDQRTRLMDTPNGQKLMEQYNTHNEVYNKAFQIPLMRRHWKGDGTTAQMAGDTSSALKTDNSVINPKDKKYKNGLTYNANAFTQQLNVAVASVMTDPNFNIFNPLSDNQYSQAGLSALSFGKAVNTTGNDKSNITELNSNDVYSTVNNHDGDIPNTSLDELQNVMSQGMGKAGADEEIKPGWIVLDEEDRLNLRKFITGVMKEKEVEKNNIAQPLWKGKCTAILNKVEAKVDINAHDISQTKVEVTLPSFDFELDDSAWTGKAAIVIRERLSQLYFIQTMLQEQIVDRIKETLYYSITKALKPV